VLGGTELLTKVERGAAAFIAVSLVVSPAEVMAAVKYRWTRAEEVLRRDRKSLEHVPLARMRG
jgi:hypothetical protein